MMMTICGISVYFYEFYQIFQLLTVKINRILLKSDKKKFEKDAEILEIGDGLAVTKIKE